MDVPVFEVLSWATSYHTPNVLSHYSGELALALSLARWRLSHIKNQHQDRRISLLEQKGRMTYSQRDDRWRDKLLGTSGLTVGAYGCYITSVAELLTLAGYHVTPGDVCDILNATEGFTREVRNKDGKLVQDSGLAIHSKIVEAYPQLSYSGSGYKIVQGKFKSGLYHYMAVSAGVLFDPWTGTNTAPCPLTGVYQNIGVVQAPVVVTVEVPSELPEFPKMVTIIAEPFLYNHTEAKVTVETRVPDDQENPDATKRTYGKLPKGNSYKVVAMVQGEDVNGNINWYKTIKGNYFSAYYTDQPNG